MKTKTNSKCIKKLSWAVLAAFSISLTTEALAAIATVGGLQQTDGATNVSLYKSKYNNNDVPINRDSQLVDLFHWTEAEFLKKTEGSAIRRVGYLGWLRNIAVALGNAPTSQLIVTALKNRLDFDSAMVREHVAWALQQHEKILL